MKTGWNRLLSVVLALVLVLGCLPAAALAEGSEEGVYQYTSNENGNKQETDDFQWYDSFTRSSFEGCDHLRLLSAQVAISSASYYGAEEDAYEQDHSDLGRNVKAMLTAMGFEDVEANAWYGAEAQENSAAVAVGHRSIEADGKTYTLLAVIPRSAGYKQEWAGNFTVGSGLIHEGFKAARDEDLRFVKQYIGAHGITGEIKVWISGHSRGAAVANLLGGFFAGGGIAYFGESVSVTPEDVYCYTFATPRTIIAGLEKNAELSVAGNRDGAYARDTVQEPFSYTGGGSVDPADPVYGGIRNYPFDHDFITYLPPAQWGYTYYGSVCSMTETMDGKPITAEEMLSALKTVNAYVYRAWTGGVLTGNYLDYPGDYRGFRTMDFDLANLSLYALDADEKMSDFIASFVGGLPALVQTPEAYQNDGYEDMMTAFAGLYGMVVVQFGDQLKENLGDLILPAVLCYLNSAYESMRAENAEATEAQASAAALAALLEHFTGGTLDPAAATADDLLALLTTYLADHADSPLMQALVELLVPLIPEDSVQLLTMLISNAVPGYDAETTTLEETIVCFLKACAYGPLPGSVWAENPAFSNISTGADVRQFLYAILLFAGLPEEVTDAIDTGSGKLTDLASALLPLLKGTDGDGVPYATLAEAADAQLRAGLQAMIDGVLARIAAEDLAYSEAFVQDIRKHAQDLLDPENPQRVTLLRNILCSLLLPAGDGSFDTAGIVQRIATFAGNLSRIPPAHYNEVFIAWAKAAVTKGTAPDEEDSGWTPDVTPHAPSVTIPVSGDGAAVGVKAELNGSTVIIRGTDIAPVLNAEEVGTVVIDASGVPCRVDAVTVPRALLTQIADAVADGTHDADGLEFRLTAGSVTFDAAAVAAIAAQAGGEDLTLSLSSVTATELNSAQQEAVAGLELLTALAARMTAGDRRISDLQGGLAAIRVPCALGEGRTAAGLTVCSLDGDGTRSEVPAAPDGETVVFSVPRFVDCVIAYDAEKAAACPKDGACPLAAFTDLDPTLWYHDGIHFCLETGIMNGVGSGKFLPGGAASRAMIVTILYRLENEPEVTAENPFADVSDGKWYTDAVIWASENRLVEGYGDGTFRPDRPITREQLAAILYRYARSKGHGFTGMWMFPLDYPDASEIASWADEAMHWMVMRFVINGKGGNLVPGGDASRAEAATMLMRFCSATAG